MKMTYGLASLMAAALTASAAHAAVNVVTFEGVTPGSEVRNYYNGGTDSAGATGPDLGVSFYFHGMAFTNLASGGSVDFTNAPSGHTALVNSQESYVNVASGFPDGFSLFYSSSAAASVWIFDDVDLKGNIIGAFSLNAQYRDDCSTDPGDTFCTWSTAGTAFAGIARSVYFGATPDNTLFDNITFGSATAVRDTSLPGVPDGGAVPEPASWALMLTGFGGLGAMLRLRRRSSALRAA